MRFMVLLKVGAAVGPDLARAIEAYGVELARAGVADPRRCAARGRRVAPEPATDGRTLAGFWVFDLESRDEAAAWVRRCPAPSDGSAEIEIRLLLAPEDLAECSPNAARPAWERAMAF